MNGLKAEILINRAMLWYVLAFVCEGSPVAPLFILGAVWNVYLSAREYRKKGL